MRLQQDQLEALAGRREQDFLGRLDPLLLPYSTAYASHPAKRRGELLGQVVQIARAHGIREELNVGLFALLALLWGLNSLRQGEAAEVLADERRHGTAKVYQLWELYRRHAPQAPVFAQQAGGH